MTSEIIYTSNSVDLDSTDTKPYAVYHTTYSGTALPSKNGSNVTPSNYIGSTSTKNIQSGYVGSVSSSRYEDLWEREHKEHPELFAVEIISHHCTRTGALEKELLVQRIFEVPKNPLFVNMSYATLNGCWGAAGIPLTETTKAKLSVSQALSHANRSEEVEFKRREKLSIANIKVQANRSEEQKTDIRSKQSVSGKVAAANMSEEKKADMVRKRAISRSSDWELISPEGEIFLTSCLHEFCDLYPELVYSSVVRCAASGKIYKGWQIRQIISE